VSSRRPRKARGPIEAWAPRPSTLALIADVQAILDENRAYWPLTIRAVYYRLLGTGRYGKGPGLADRVSEHVGNARRAGVKAPGAYAAAWPDSRNGDGRAVVARAVR
jgi:hypothetical protein